VGHTKVQRTTTKRLAAWMKSRATANVEEAGHCRSRHPSSVHRIDQTQTGMDSRTVKELLLAVPAPSLSPATLSYCWRRLYQSWRLEIQHRASRRLLRYRLFKALFLSKTIPCTWTQIDWKGVVTIGISASCRLVCMYVCCEVNSVTLYRLRCKTKMAAVLAFQ